MKDNKMRLFLYFILFGLEVHFVNATDADFDRYWKNAFSGRNLPQQEIKEPCKDTWNKAKRFADEAKQAGIFIGNDYVKKKLDNQWKKHYYKNMEENWFLPFIKEFVVETQRGEIQKRLAQPENYVYEGIRIGTDRDEMQWTLGLIAELNTTFNYPLISLSNSIKKSKLYATVVFRMQDAKLLVDRRINDHGALVLEYCDNDTWKSIMVHYHNARNGGSSGSGGSGSGEHIVSVRDKTGTYQCILWDPNASLANHTHVSYFRYATFTLSRKNSDQKLKVMEGGKPYIQPHEYAMRGIDGYDNCHTYVARLLELFSYRPIKPGAPPLHWPEVPLKDCYYHQYKIFSPWFTAESLRSLIDQAQNKGKNKITRYDDTLSPALRPKYMTKEKEPQLMPSFPTKLYENYWTNKDDLLDLWNNREAA